MITFILVIIISFIFVKIAFGYLLGIDYTKNSSNSDSNSASNSDSNSDSNSASNSDSNSGSNSVTAAAVANTSSNKKDKYTNLSEAYGEQIYNNM